LNFEQDRSGTGAHVITLPLPQLRQVDRSQGSLQRQVYRELRRGLMVGAFVPGQAVSLRMLAKRLDTSPMPLRDAVNRLIAERALQMLPNRSVVVPVLTRDELAELTVVRQLLEGQATAQAATRATSELVELLRQLSAKLLDEIEAHNVPAMLECHQRFHFAIYRASDYQLILPMIESLWLQVGPVMNFSVSASPVRWDVSHHGNIMDALEQGDETTARREMELDIAVTIGYLLDQLDKSADLTSAEPADSVAAGP
jgi:DNA-binding GntR family transcriptional regulator